MSFIESDTFKNCNFHFKIYFFCVLLCVHVKISSGICSCIVQRLTFPERLESITKFFFAKVTAQLRVLKVYSPQRIGSPKTVSVRAALRSCPLTHPWPHSLEHIAVNIHQASAVITQLVLDRMISNGSHHSVRQSSMSIFCIV